MQFGVQNMQCNLGRKRWNYIKLLTHSFASTPSILSCSNLLLTAIILLTDWVMSAWACLAENMLDLIEESGPPDICLCDDAVEEERVDDNAFISSGWRFRHLGCLKQNQWKKVSIFGAGMVVINRQTVFDRTWVMAYFLLPDSHSLLLIVDSHRTFVGGKRSSWKYAVFTLGTVNEIGSIIVLLSLNALANSTSRTLHTFLGRNENPWCNPAGL